MYNDKLVYKVVIWVFNLGYFKKREGSFKSHSNHMTSSMRVDTHMPHHSV